jgi:hypothetical protein
MAAGTTITVTTGNVTTSSRKTVTMSVTFPPAGDRQPQRPIPAGQEVGQHGRQRPEEQLEQEKVPQGQS